MRYNAAPSSTLYLLWLYCVLTLAGAAARRHPPRYTYYGSTAYLLRQALQRGAIIHAHVDEPGVGGEAIATAVIAGASEVRVGGVAFTVAEGDMYFLVGAARDDVDHEVYAGQQDRLSVTIRYGAQANSIQSERA